jgi:hypothetical protein
MLVTFYKGEEYLDICTRYLVLSFTYLIGAGTTTYILYINDPVMCLGLYGKGALQERGSERKD